MLETMIISTALILLFIAVGVPLMMLLGLYNAPKLHPKH